MALLALLEARHPLAAIAARHAPWFRVAGIAGADVQCMPYQICGACDAPYRHAQKANRCLVCGHDALQEFSFTVADGRRLTRAQIERDYYRNTHLVLGRRTQGGYGVDPGTPVGPAEQPFPSQVVCHLANMFRDAAKIGGAQRDSFLAFTLGWFSHVVSDALFKGVYPHAARVQFFGHQYHMAMLPAVEMLTMTDISYDFGVHWPSWHEELLRDQSDGGALRHLTMGNEPDAYDRVYWTSEFGLPDPAIGRVMNAVPPLNRTWFHRMYLTPDYSAPSPGLDKRKFSDRADWTFEGRDPGQVRAYAINSGWYGTFIKGVDIYLRIVTEAAQTAKPDERLVPPGVESLSWTSWSLWRRVVEEAAGRKPEADWGSRLQISTEALPLLKRLRGTPARLVVPSPSTDYQKSLAEVIQTAWGIKPEPAANVTIMIGSPAFNTSARALLCREDALRSKYGSGLAGLVKWLPESRVLHIVGLSDFGDSKLKAWLLKNAH